MATNYTPAEAAESRARLLDLVPMGSRVHTIRRHMSASGQQQEVGLIVSPVGSDDIVAITYHVAVVLGRKLSQSPDRRAGIVCRGVQMDLGDALVQHLSHELYGDDYALKQSWI